MALLGAGAIIIWNDITPEGRDGFYDWHLNEHIPERLAIPGFLRGSRYIAAAPDTRPEFLTLYEIADAAVATSAPYLGRLEAPTAWTKRATAHFRNTSRALTRAVASYGPGSGGVVGTLRLDGSNEGQAALAKLHHHLDRFDGIARMPRVSGAHLCMTNVEASTARTAESRERADILSAPIGAVLIEGCDVATVSGALVALTSGIGIKDVSAHAGVYRLEHQLIAPRR